MISNNKYYSLTAEKELISCLLVSEKDSEYRRIILLLEEDDFYYQQTKNIYKIIRSLAEKNEYVDMLTVKENAYKLKIQLNIRELAEHATKESNTPVYELFRIVREKNINRQIKEIELNNEVTPQKIIELKKSLENTEIENIELNPLKHYLEYLDAGNKRGFDTGFTLIDEYTLGLKKGHYWSLGAYTNTGKTTIALQVVLKLLQQKAKVLFFSLEMPEGDLISRLFEIAKVQHGEEEAKRLFSISEDLLKITSRIRNLNKIETYIERNDVDVVFIDYLQNVDVKTNRQLSIFEKMTEVSNNIQRMALEHNICFFCLSQVNEESNKTNKIQSIGFKGSGALNSDPNVTIIPVRNFDEEAKNNDRYSKITMNLRRNRHGKTSSFNLCYDLQNGIVTNKLFVDSKNYNF